MDETIISAPAVAKGTRMLATRRRASPVVVALEKTEPPPPVDVHIECRAREQTLAQSLRRELEEATARDLESTRDAARAEGREQGLEAGRAEGLEEARAAEENRSRRFEALIAAIDSRHEAGLASAREGALAIGFAAACRILGAQVVTAEGVRGIVEQLLVHARAGERATVRLNGEDLALLRGSRGAEDIAAERPVEFLEDDGLARGDCCIDTGAGTLETRLAGQVEALREALLAAHRATLAQGRAEGAQGEDA